MQGEKQILHIQGYAGVYFRGELSSARFEAWAVYVEMRAVSNQWLPAGPPLPVRYRAAAAPLSTTTTMMVCSSVTQVSSESGRGGGSAIVGLQLITASTGAAEATARDSRGDGRQQQAAGGGFW
jgi:hypothetical protein